MLSNSNWQAKLAWCEVLLEYYL